MILSHYSKMLQQIILMSTIKMLFANKPLSYKSEIVREHKNFCYFSQSYLRLS